MEQSLTVERLWKKNACTYTGCVIKLDTECIHLQKTEYQKKDRN